MNRKPAVAGSFYPAHNKELTIELESLFSDAAPSKHSDVRAVIVPHAGYVFSGGVAASAFNQINRERSYKRVFILGSAHRNSFSGASVYVAGNFEMPYGEEPVDLSFGETLCRELPALFSSNPSHHQEEHSIEVQLPFLNHVLKDGYKIVPILIGAVSADDCREIAGALAPWFNEENLFVVSSDFSHYPAYEDACVTDKETMEAIVSNNPGDLAGVLDRHSAGHADNLYTSLCGWSSVLTLMNITAGDAGYEYNALEYKNSGDNEQYGEKDRVVGYWAIDVVQRQVANDEMDFTRQEKEALLRIAARSIEMAVAPKIGSGGNFVEPGVDEEVISGNLASQCGVFVTLKKKGELRGCIGYIESDNPLYKEVANVAELAACHDYRFNRVQPYELADINLEISVLSPMRLISDVNEILPGKHGIHIVKGERSGLFLPQVAEETGWNLEEYLGHCSRDKAGIGWDGWKSADIYIFTVTIL